VAAREDAASRAMAEAAALVEAAEERARWVAWGVAGVLRSQLCVYMCDGAWGVLSPVVRRCVSFI
jgi:hypothetical protein